MNQYSNRNFLSSIPVVTKNLLIINFLAWLLTIVLMRIGVDIQSFLGLHYFSSERFIPTQLLTYLFMHDTHGFSHVFFNMFGVYMFGRIVEQTWGSKRFLLFYLVAGVGAGIVQELTWAIDLYSKFSAISAANPNVLITYKEFISANVFYINNMITIGASGAVFGILLAFGMLFPNIPLYIMFIPIPVKAKYMVIGYGVLELFSGVASFSGDNVAHFAHLGGMLFGYFLILYWKKKGVNNYDGNIF